jgi:hypothetical protein
MENPKKFEEFKQFGINTVALVNTTETTMGGPRIGKLNVNGKSIVGNFGGPFFCAKEILYIPKLRFKLFEGRSFDLCIYDIVNRKVVYVPMYSSGFGVLDVDDNYITLISGLYNNAVFKIKNIGLTRMARD